MNTRRWTLGAVLFAVVATTSPAATSPAATTMPARPRLHVTTIDGKTFDLAAQRGHWVIVNYWATWCVPCIKEMPDISNFVNTHKNVRAIGLAYEDSEPADIQDFLRKRPVAYPVAQVTLDKPLADFDPPTHLPTTYLIDPQGRVAQKFVGPLTATWLQENIRTP